METQQGDRHTAAIRFKSRGRYKGSREVKPFSGGNWKRWLEFQREIDRLYSFLNMDDRDRSARGLRDVLQQLLHGRDLDLFHQRVQAEHDDGESWARAIVLAMGALTERYCPVGSREQLHQEIKAFRKTRSMTVSDYAERFEDLVSLERWTLRTDGTPLTDAEKCHLFSQGMPRQWQMQVVPQQRQRTELHDLRERYVQCERIDGQFPDRHAKTKKDQKGRGEKKPKEANRQEKGERKTKLEKRPREDKTGCKYCKAQGNVWKNHNDDECFRNPASPRFRPRTGKDKGSTSTSKKRMSLKQESSAAVQQQHEEDDTLGYWHTSGDQGEESAAVQNERPPSGSGAVLRTTITLRHPLSKKSFSALLDTGSTKSLVAKEVVSWFTPQNQQRWIRNVNDELQPAMGEITLPFCLSDFTDKRQCQQEFMIIDKLLHPVILGTEFMKEQGITIDYKKHTIRWDDMEIPMDRRPEPVRRVAVAVHDPEDRTMRILDVTGKEIDLQKLVPKEHLTLDQRSRLRDLLLSFRVVFLGGIGKMKLKPYELPVKKGSIPKEKRPYPIPLIHREATLREVERLVKLGVLEPDKESPWAAPAFIIAKKDGSIRFLTDYRELNTCLQRHYYPLPRIQDLIRELPRPAFVSALDLVMGYYSREIAEKSRPYTAVVLPWGKCRYCRLPMGISTAPDEFHAVMQELLGDLPYVRVYLDDVLVLSESFDEHLQHLRVVLKRLQDVGIIVHPEKSKFCMTQVEYLGFCISRRGKEPLQSKVKAILKIGRPRTIRDLRRFIGMVNYYKDMWRGRSEALASLTALTSRKRPYQWTNVEQKAFEQVKQMVAQKVRLQYPDFNLPFEVFTDASAHQLGGVIMQQGKPLAFWSKKCNQTQEQYTMNKKELLSIVEMLREFRTILWGREIKVYTDHKNSVEATFRNMQMLRWRLEIEEYGVTMIYIRGQDNIVADALSRLPLSTGKTTSAAVSAAASSTEEEPPTFSLSLEEIAKTQLTVGLHEGPAACWRAIGSTRVLVSKVGGKIILPGPLVGKVLQTYHQWLMHPGEKIMLESIRATMIWPGMTIDGSNWVRGCKQCARSKKTQKKYGKIPAKTVEVRPWAEIAADSIGPFGPHQWRAMTIIDTSTRLLEIAAMDDGTSEEAARIMDQWWLNRYPRPKRCIYDQGPEFKAEFVELLDSYGVERRPNTAKNPQANGVIERVHRTINDKLRTTEIATRGQWENCLSAVMFATRAQYHSMLAMSPGAAAFSRDMLFDYPVTWNPGVQQGRKERQVQYNNDRENAGRVEHEYQPDDMVMVSRNNARAPKLQEVFDGPFPVISVRSDGIIVVEKKRYQESIHMRRVKPFRSTSMGEDVVPEDRADASRPPRTTRGGSQESGN